MDLNILRDDYMNTQEDHMDTMSGGCSAVTGKDFKNAQKCMTTGFSDLRNASASVRKANQKLFERKKSCSRDPISRKSRNYLG